MILSNFAYCERKYGTSVKSNVWLGKSDDMPEVVTTPKLLAPFVYNQQFTRPNDLFTNSPTFDPK